MEDIVKSARNTLIRGANSVQGICETLRLTYDLICDLPDKELKEKITERLVEAMVMAKKMRDRLTYYKATYNDKTGHGLKNLKALTGTSTRMKIRRRRTI